MAGKLNYGEFSRFVVPDSGSGGTPEGDTARGPQSAVSDVIGSTPVHVDPNPGYWTDALPTVLGTAGGMGGTAIGGPIAGVAGGAAGSALGEILRQRANELAGRPLPEDPRGEVLNQALWGGGSELGGQLIAGGVGALGRSSMRGAVRDPLVAETAMELRGSVGRMRGKPGTLVARARGQVDAANAELERLISSAEAAGVKADPREFERVLMNRVRAANLNKTANQEAVHFWNGKLAAWREQWNLHPTNPQATVVQVRDPATGRIVKTLRKTDIGIRELNELKRMNATEAERLAKASKHTGGDRRITLDEQYASDISRWARARERQLVPGQGGKGLEWANQQQAKYKRALDVAEGIESPKPGKPLHRVEPKTFMGTTIPSMNPSIASRLGLALTGPAAHGAARAGANVFGYALRGPGSFRDQQRTVTDLPINPNDFFRPEGPQK